MEVKWEDFGNGLNRKMNTMGKSQMILHDEFNSKQSVEEYLEDFSFLPQSSLDASAPPSIMPGLSQLVSPAAHPNPAPLSAQNNVFLNSATNVPNLSNA